MKAVIVAAGMGSRLWNQTNKTPKTLMPFGSETILSTILKNISATGIQEFVIVIGYRKDDIVNYLNKNDDFGFKITYIENPEWQKGNGISVLAAEKAVTEDRFLLSMSDHIVSVPALQKILNHGSSKNLLLVDPDVNSIFDIDDATKVEVVNNAIINIGKELTHYNAIDCGIFKLTNSFFDAMREQLKKSQESISAAIKRLILNTDMEAVFLDEHDFWIDIDTPESYQYALQFKQDIT